MFGFRLRIRMASTMTKTVPPVNIDFGLIDEKESNPNSF
jgi:hypothetical protein